MKKRLYLIDGSSYIYRAYHAIRGLTNSKGFPTNAVFGFTKMLLKLINDKSPEYIAMLFDAKGKTFRHEIYTAYKANRPPMPEDMAIQIPYIKAIINGFCIPIIEMTGYEADDLAGTLARKAEAAGFSVVMVTGDKDFVQLITENIMLWDPMKDKTTDKAGVKNDFHIDPEQIIDVMGLSGDTSDNIPGVPGIGQKTALALIQTFKGISSLYERIDEVKQKKKQYENLIQYKAQAFLSKDLVTIRTDVPISFEPDALKRKEPDTKTLSELFKELEFRQLQHDLPRTADRSQKRYHAVDTMKSLTNLVQQLESSEIFAVDTETTSEDPMKAKLVGISFSAKPNEAFYIPCAHDILTPVGQLSCEIVLTRLKPLLENPDIQKVGQNIKYDMMVLEQHGIRLKGVVFDTMVGSYLLNPSKRAHNLDQIALDFLDYKKITYQEVAGNSLFSQVPVENAVQYACEDADITLAAYQVLKPKLDELGLTRLLKEVEMPLIPVLKKMEMCGICVDKEKLGELSDIFQHQLETLEQEIYALAGEQFNIGSPKQLGYILFEKLNLPVQKKTKKKTGYSTDAEVLTLLATRHDLPARILNHRTLSKMKSTYADALLDMIHPKTGRIHTSYNQTVTVTGRLSSSEPNLQNIPVRTEEGRQIRSAFVPQPGWYFLSADYSQIELRILAHYSEDEILLKAFQDQEDIHTRTAAEVFQTDPDAVTPELRRQAKAINFGIIYGMSPYGLAKELGIGQKMAKTYIENYFRRYKGVKAFTDQIIEQTKETKQTGTLLGRIRLLPEINSSNSHVRKFAERTAINTPIQGTAADLIKIAMVKVDAEFAQQNLKSAMLLSVHDELVFEVPPDEVDEVSTRVRTVMEGVWNLKTPLKVNIAVGKNWAEAH